MIYQCSTNICVSNKAIIVYNWYEHGIKTVGDLQNEDGQFLKPHDYVQCLYKAKQQ